jgi:phage terminase large subunit-like protein
MVGMPLLPWQERFLEQMLGETEAGSWAASEVGLLVPRQNGKSFLMAARILAGLFLVGESLITYTAHRVDTALEIFNLVDRLARSHPETKRRIRRTQRAQGKETIELISGERFKIQARSRGTGRGFSGDCLIFDEALELRDQAAINAMVPTLATHENNQVVYASSAGDAGSVVLAALRERGRRGESQSLCYVEYAADREADPDDLAAILDANPGMPDLIGIEAVRREREAMSLDGFRQERLGIWSHELSRAVIPGSIWQQTAGIAPGQPSKGKLGLAFDVSIDRAWSSIVVAWRIEETTYLRVARHQQGDGWLLAELQAMAEAYEVPISYDDAGPARDIGEALAIRGILIDRIGGRDYASACARLLSGLTAGQVIHHPFGPLDAAASAATSRTIGDAWAFARRDASVSISPITAAALAVWAADHELVVPLPPPMIW